MSNVECAVMTSKQAAQYLGVSKSTFYAYIRKGLIKKPIVYTDDLKTCSNKKHTSVWRKKYLDEFLDRLEQEQTAEG